MHAEIIMNNKGWIIGAALSVLLCAAALALRHSYSPRSDPRPLSVIVRLTPALKARRAEAYRLEQAAAAALEAGRYAQAEADARKSMAIGPDAGLAQELLAAALDAQ